MVSVPLQLFRRLCLVPCLAAATQRSQQLRAAGLGTEPMVRDPQVHQELIVCNAFADAGTLEAKIMPSEEPLRPLSYKQCSRTALQLKEGDRVDFRCRGLDVGTFGISGLP